MKGFTALRPVRGSRRARVVYVRPIALRGLFIARATAPLILVKTFVGRIYAHTSPSGARNTLGPLTLERFCAQAHRVLHARVPAPCSCSPPQGPRRFVLCLRYASTFGVRSSLRSVRAASFGAHERRLGLCGPRPRGPRPLTGASARSFAASLGCGYVQEARVLSREEGPYFINRRVNWRRVCGSSHVRTHDWMWPRSLLHTSKELLRCMRQPRCGRSVGVTHESHTCPVASQRPET